MKLLKLISVSAASLSLLACGHGKGAPANTSSPQDVAHVMADCPELTKYTLPNGQRPLTVTTTPNQHGIQVNDAGETWVVDGESHHSKTGLVYRGACNNHRVYVSFYRGDKPYGQQTYDWNDKHQYMRKDHWERP